MPYLSASEVMIHYEEALYQVYAPLPLPDLDLVLYYSFISTFDQNFVLLAEHHYLQTLSDVSIA